MHADADPDNTMNKKLINNFETQRKESSNAHEMPNRILGNEENFHCLPMREGLVERDAIINPSKVGQGMIWSDSCNALEIFLELFFFATLIISLSALLLPHKYGMGKADNFIFRSSLFKHRNNFVPLTPHRHMNSG